MDIDDLIKTLAPFAFVIFWVGSAIFSKAEEVAKARGPLLKPNPPNPFQTTNIDSATVAPSRPTQLDWSDLAAGQPASPTSQKPPIGKPSVSEIRAAQQRRKKSPANRSDIVSLSDQTKTRQAIPEMPADKMGVPQMQLLHLVPDHAADVHLNQSLAHQQATAERAKSQNALDMQVLLSRLKRPGAVREAMILSVILDEPKCKKMMQKG